MLIPSNVAFVEEFYKSCPGKTITPPLEFQDFNDENDQNGGNMSNSEQEDLDRTLIPLEQEQISTYKDNVVSLSNDIELMTKNEIRTSFISGVNDKTGNQCTPHKSSRKKTSCSSNSPIGNVQKSSKNLSFMSDENNKNFENSISRMSTPRSHPSRKQGTRTSHSSADNVLNKSMENMSPIRTMNPIVLAHSSKYSPLDIIPVRTSHMNKSIITSTPKQQTILNYIAVKTSQSDDSKSVTSQTLGNYELSRPKKPCVACTRLNKEQVNYYIFSKHLYHLFLLKKMLEVYR